MKYRGIHRVFRGRATFDGAGVRLRRIFGNGETKHFDPFLLLDEFGSDDPSEYLPGFPLHPHRGIDTVTYMLEGTVRHGDSLGNVGTIGPGDLQWMTAGSGILHEEMPQASPRGIRGFQLWVNLAAKEKMRDPRYREAKSAEVPIVAIPGGGVKVICGRFGGFDGVFRDVSGNPSYLDVRLDPGSEAELEAPSGETAFAYLYNGSAGNRTEGGEGRGEPATQEAGACLLFGEGNSVSVRAGPGGCRFLFVRGRPLGEPIAWGGPIVMNTMAELESAFRELEDGSFVRNGGRKG